MDLSLNWLWQTANKPNVNLDKHKNHSICSKLSVSNAVQVRAGAFMLYHALCIIKIAPKARQLNRKIAET